MISPGGTFLSVAYPRLPAFPRGDFNIIIWRVS